MRNVKRVVIGVLSVGLIASFGTGQNASAVSKAPSAPNARVGQFIPETKFTGVGLGDAIDFIRDVTNLNIHVNWQALAEANVTRDTPINVRLQGVSVRKVLNVILNEAAGGDALTFYVEGNVIEITTRALADQRMVTRVYPIEDLLLVVPDFTDAPDFNLQNDTTGSGSKGVGGGSGGGGGGGIFTQNTQTEEKTETKEQRAEKIVELITSTVHPDIWTANGGTAACRYFNGSLVITAPVSVHELIGG